MVFFLTFFECPKNNLFNFIIFIYFLILHTYSISFCDLNNAAIQSHFASTTNQEWFHFYFFLFVGGSGKNLLVGRKSHLMRKWYRLHETFVLEGLGPIPPAKPSKRRKHPPADVPFFTFP